MSTIEKTNFESPSILTSMFTDLWQYRRTHCIALVGGLALASIAAIFAIGHFSFMAHAEDVSLIGVYGGVSVVLGGIGHAFVSMPPSFRSEKQKKDVMLFNTLEDIRRDAHPRQWTTIDQARQAAFEDVNPMESGPYEALYGTLRQLYQETTVELYRTMPKSTWARGYEGIARWFGQEFTPETLCFKQKQAIHEALFIVAESMLLIVQGLVANVPEENQQPIKEALKNNKIQEAKALFEQTSNSSTAVRLLTIALSLPPPPKNPSPSTCAEPHQ